MKSDNITNRMSTNRAPSPAGSSQSRASTALPRLRKNSPVPSETDIAAMKVKIQKLEEETKQMKTKTQRMRQVIKERNNNIKSTFSAGANRKPLTTASESTIKSLKESIQRLENTLESRQAELDKLKKSDKVAQYQELQYEIQVMHIEKLRVEKESKELQKENQLLKSTLQETIEQAKNGPLYNQRVLEIQNEINLLTEKLFSYEKSQLKIENAKRIQESKKDESENTKEDTRNKTSKDQNKTKEKNKKTDEERRNELIQSLFEECDQLEKEIEDEEQSLAQLKKSEQQAIDDLNKEIDEQVRKLRELFKEPENEEEDQPEK